MAKQKNEFKLSLLKNREWYHQRFDGCPMFMWFIADSELKKEKRKPAGTEADIRVSFFYHGVGDWYLDMKDVRRGARVIVNLAKTDKKISTRLLAAWKKDEQSFDNFWQKFPKVDLKKMSDGELARFWNKYWNLGANRFTSSAIIDHFALGTDELIGQMLRKELKGEWDKESDFTRLFSIATAPVHQSFINQAEIELLKIIVGKSKDSLDEYQKKYYWTKNNYYIAQHLSVDFFKKEIKAWKASGKNLNLELKRIADTPKNNQREKNKLLKKYNLSPLLQTLLKISEDFTWWQDERKRATYINIDLGTKILAEVAKRAGYTVEELKHAVPSELVDILIKHLPTRKELVSRMQSVFVVTRDWLYIARGQEMKDIKKAMFGDKKQEQLMDFRGLSASTGRAIGPVKIVKSATEIGKVKAGDVLVAVMTRPDYIVAMKKAAAIVTNEGGITSHAAIVSRELGIPCIIGTKIATEVLKDGDLVEVNANHGWVRIINKA